MNNLLEQLLNTLMVRMDEEESTKKVLMPLLHHFGNGMKLLKYEMGWPSCMRTAPMPTFDASVSITKSISKLGNRNTGALTMACLRAAKAVDVLGVHIKPSLQSKLVSGATIDA